MLNTIEHTGGVTSSTADGALVSEPVAVTIEQIETCLSLEDARDLVKGLQLAIEAAEEAEQKVRSSVGEHGHCLIIGSTRTGMSVAHSKLGKNPSEYTMDRFMAQFPPKMRTAEYRLDVGQSSKVMIQEADQVSRLMRAGRKISGDAAQPKQTPHWHRFTKGRF